MAAKSTGNCYLCGGIISKIAMKNHLLKAHVSHSSGQECYLIKIEDAYTKDYWLYIDVPVEKTLSTIDTFLRKPDVLILIAHFKALFIFSCRSDIGEVFRCA